PRLGEDHRVVALHLFKQAQGSVVTGTWTYRRVEPWDGLEVVVVNIWPCGANSLDRWTHLASEVGCENFDRGRRRISPKRFDHLDELPRSAVREIVSVDRSDHDVLESHLGGGDGHVLGLERIDLAGHTGLHVAEGAGSRADVAEDHHRRMLLRPAFPDIRAGRFLTDGIQVQFAHQRARFLETLADGCLHPDPVRLALTGRR